MDDHGHNISELIHSAQRGEPGAVNRLLGAYRNYLSMLARLWVERPLERKFDPSDVAQEAILKAYQKFGDFRGTTEAELAGWLRQILARTVVDMIRHVRAATRDLAREYSVEQMLDGSSQKIAAGLATREPSPVHAVQRREFGVMLADVLAELSADHREVIVLRNLQELDWPRIAERMGRSPDAVRMLWTRGLEELRLRIEAP